LKLEIHVQDIRQTVEVKDADEALSALKKEAASRAPFLLKGIIIGMGDLQFAGEVVKRANAAEKREDPIPKSAREFLDWAVARNYATILEA